MHRSVLGPAARKTHVFDALEICPNGSIEGRMIQRMEGRYGLQQDDFSRIRALQFCTMFLMLVPCYMCVFPGLV